MINLSFALMTLSVAGHSFRRFDNSIRRSGGSFRRFDDPIRRWTFFPSL
ncbi:hypothetical protein [Lysinibacillus sp. G4S2]|nr:hypothetical protein [Lysinibacillus sp. G4S2]MDM5249979.1 hypothetical protein [Lysinibacillus sp. G4S2]